MTAGRDDDVDPACRLGEHQYCSGNIDLKPGPGPALALHRCACSCHRGQTAPTSEAKNQH
jgi:hypothetical protein